MKGKRIDALVMDDIVSVVPTDGTPESAAKARQMEKLVNHYMKQHAEEIEKTILFGTFSIPRPDPDYEDAKDLIREVVSGQDQENQTP